MSPCASWMVKFLVQVWLLAAVSASRKSNLYPLFSTLTSSDNASNNNSLLIDDSSNSRMIDDSNNSRISTNATMRCDDARLRCAYRTGCGSALQQYLTSCMDVLRGDVNHCPEHCQHALIALTSTDEGKELTTCECEKGDVVCLLSKQNVEICRSSVTMTMNRTRVSCRVATWICSADALCSTALQYYNEYCKKMFRGKKCTNRCRNSIEILRRQEKSAKLRTCLCDGPEDYDCISIHRNMNWLCYGLAPHEYQIQLVGDTQTNEILKNNDDSDLSSAVHLLANGTTSLILALVVLLHSIAKQV